MPGNNHLNETTLSNVNDNAANVSKRDSLLLLNKFINSSDFLYLPAAPQDVSFGSGSMDLNDMNVYDRNASALAALNAHKDMVHSDGISAEALEEIKLYKLRNSGALPASLG